MCTWDTEVEYLEVLVPWDEEVEYLEVCVPGISNGNASETKANESFDNGVFFDIEA
jgi:hypothetical protein